MVRVRWPVLHSFTLCSAVLKYYLLRYSIAHLSSLWCWTHRKNRTEQICRSGRQLSGALGSKHLLLCVCHHVTSVLFSILVNILRRRFLKMHFGQNPLSNTCTWQLYQYLNEWYGLWINTSTHALLYRSFGYIGLMQHVALSHTTAGRLVIKNFPLLCTAHTVHFLKR